MDGESVTVGRASTPAIPRRRTHEVIDVDELDDEQYQRPSRRTRHSVPRGSLTDSESSEVIILDSDDGLEPGPSTRRRPSDTRFRSPPPPVQIIHTPPPVPPLPLHHRPRHHPHVFPPDVIRPNAEPFAFERTMAPQLMRPTSHPPDGEAPPSHHRPVINLGGGFISSNRQLEAESFRRQQARDRARQRYFDHLRIARGIHQRHGFLSHTLGRIFPSWLFGDPTEEEMMDALAFSELAAAEAGPFGFGDDRARVRRMPDEYRVAYTHPYPPASGFTHDFESQSPPVSVIDVDEEPGPSTKAPGSSSPNKIAENMNTLVCARCLDPLVLGGSNMSEGERTRRRLWGLRCGHMLDGKCITELMKPRSALESELPVADTATIEHPRDTPPGQNFSSQSPDVTQKLVPRDVLPTDVRPAIRRTRARGKARAIERPSHSSQPAEGTGEQTDFAEDSSIRSRLRPRNNLGHPSSQRTPAIVTPPAAVAHANHDIKRRAKAKGKQKAMEPVILERHEWRCPVALCDRLHLTLHIESRGWIMDETQGAIPIFA